MTVFERIEKLRKSTGISQGKLEKELGFSNGSISKWKNSTPKSDRLQKIADYFGVSVEYLMTGKDDAEKAEITLTSKDERDIAKDLDNIMEKIQNGKDGPLRFNGDEIDPESLEFLRDAIGMSLRHLKIINKEKYNPYKNKK
ncbi:UNVERIFIED_ORG: transcriptional regulator [Lacrimispora saccharolytica]